MKKIIVIANVLVWSCIAVQAQSQKLKEIAGKWEVLGEKDASLTIIDSSTIELSYMGEKKQILNYKIDFTKSPHWFDFSATEDSSVIHIKSLVQKVGDDVLKWQLFIDEERSPHFTTGKGEVFYLRKSRPGASIVAASH
jgi:hypothetical protein